MVNGDLAYGNEVKPDILLRTTIEIKERFEDEEFMKRILNILSSHKLDKGIYSFIVILFYLSLHIPFKHTFKHV